MTKLKELVSFPLAGAYLCPENGGHVTNSAEVCSCGNTNLLNLARILDRASSTAAAPDTFIGRMIEFLEERFL